MNIYVVRQATQGLANWVKTQGGKQLVAISYDSRINSDVFAKTAASVLAANGIKVRIYDALMPVPALSFATRYYEANAGIMVTASHNPAKYNGYKAYGPDGCQMTDEAADIVYTRRLWILRKESRPDLLNMWATTVRKPCTRLSRPAACVRESALHPA